MSKYAIGVDFGTESGRAVLVDVSNGKEIATAVYPYSNGVIDEKLPGTQTRLEPDWALQDPQDYIRTFQNTIPSVLKESGVDPEDVIGIGIDFTACTMLPVKADGTPLSDLPDFREQPHAWVKLWKHHAAQPEADKINKASRGSLEPASPMYYNDQPPDMIFYQGKANEKLGQESTAHVIYSKLVDYGEKHLEDQVTIDYFAVSLPDFLIFDQDLNQRNRIHCHYMTGLGYLNLGENTKAADHFERVLSLDIYHIGATVH